MFSVELCSSTVYSLNKFTSLFLKIYDMLSLKILLDLFVLVCIFCFMGVCACTVEGVPADGTAVCAHESEKLPKF
jgi:hypothetical protein